MVEEELTLNSGCGGEAGRRSGSFSFSGSHGALLSIRKYVMGESRLIESSLDAKHLKS